jgi:hypothetical protein
MKPAIRKQGRLVIGEPYWLKQPVPAEYTKVEGMENVHTEQELLEISQEEGFDFEYMVRASHDDWDNYEATNWRGLSKWIADHPQHPEQQEVIDYLHNTQNEYLRFGREFLGWAIYVLRPVDYK